MFKRQHIKKLTIILATSLQCLGLLFNSENSKLIDIREKSLQTCVKVAFFATFCLAESVVAKDESTQIGVCLAQHCRSELVHCAADNICRSYMTCIQRCDGVSCQIKCGDSFADKTIDNFIECVITRNKCVKSTPDDGRFPQLDNSIVLNRFNPHYLDGKWYITAGLNRQFDTHSCQVHAFKHNGKSIDALFTWQINNPDRKNEKSTTYSRQNDTRNNACT